MANKQRAQQLEVIKDTTQAANDDVIVKGHKLSTYEYMIAKVAGVSSAKLKADDNENIVECHVLADTTRNVKQIVRDIQSVLMAKYGLDVDYKKISVAQVHQIVTNDTNPQQQKSNRVAIGPMNIKYLQNHIEVSITLIGQNEEFIGEDVGNDSPESRVRAIAGATIDAVNRMVGNPAAYELLEVKRVMVAGQDACVVAVCGRLFGSEEHHLGCVYTRGDVNRAAVRAVLDAVNRRLRIGWEGAK